jgi:hypothetical protein
MTDPVEIMNRFTEFNPSKGETPLPLPIPGHWFRKICALADRIAAAEDTVSAQAATIAALEEENAIIAQMQDENATLRADAITARIAAEMDKNKIADLTAMVHPAPAQLSDDPIDLAMARLNCKYRSIGIKLYAPLVERAWHLRERCKVLAMAGYSLRNAVILWSKSSGQELPPELDGACREFTEEALKDGDNG